MTTKQAILAKGEKAHNNLVMTHHPNIDYRAPKDNYKESYTQDQIDYLFEHGILEEYVKTGANWESSYKEYWQFTDKGKRLRNWYGTTIWNYIKIYILKKYWWKHKWQEFRIKCGHHYDWQDYEGLDISEI